MSAYPFASGAKVEETLDVLGTRNIATTQQTLLQQILVACSVSGAPSPPTSPTLLGPDGTSSAQFVFADFTLTWSAVPGFTLYNLYAALFDEEYTLWAGDIADTSSAVNFAAAFGNANWWYVIAHDGEGNFSAESNHLQCTSIL